ncbi:META domain-containing protein [Cellulosimicrobium cellulans]|uniref:META domain-containing protein n=1 Tax=Cellulosimicrobium cellulans TaxID=1710 RepID=UPI001EDA4CD0|nr:META domain-containing protein [Cellulosimicrobium cellulans]UKJ62924.1 META domain-containing protein [Cellulosimicrobium cellulans]
MTRRRPPCRTTALPVLAVALLASCAGPGVDAPLRPGETAGPVPTTAAPEPALVPDGTAPATAADMVGRWQPGTDYATDPHVVLAEDGSWTGTDGCNDSAGSWLVEAEGRLVVTSGGHTEIGCEGEPVPDFLARSARAGLDGGVLVLVDHDGAELARLDRG